MKKLFFGVAVIAIAISASAFTNAKIVDPTFAQTSSNNYVRVDYNDGTCLTPTDKICAYTITAAGLAAGIQNGGPYSASQMDNFLGLPTPYVQVLNADKKIFVLN